MNRILVDPGVGRSLSHGCLGEGYAIRNDHTNGS